MIYKLIETIIRSFNFISYHLALLNVNYLGKYKFIHPENMLLNQIYKEYLEAVLLGEIFPQSKFGYRSSMMSKKENIFLKLRKTNKVYLTKANEEYLISKLKSNIGKWFVPYVLSVTNDFSDKLITELLETAIKVYDPSYNSCFIKPALRVNNTFVFNYLRSRFPNSTTNDKKGILRAYYWIIPKSLWRRETDKIQADYSDKYVWNNSGYYEKDYDLSEIELIIARDKVQQNTENLIEVFLDEYLTSKNENLNEIIAYYLPKELDDFSDRLKEKGALYLRMKNN